MARQPTNDLVALRAIMRERSFTPATPQALAGHRCVNLRFPTHGGLYAWLSPAMSVLIEALRYRRKSDWMSVETNG